MEKRKILLDLLSQISSKLVACSKKRQTAVNIKTKIKQKQEKLRTYKRYIEERSRNQCCRRKIISVTYSECVFVDLFFPARKAHAPYHIVMCSLPGRLYHIFPHYLTNGTIFGKNINKMCVL
jgi:hypothetical protein